MKTQRAPLANEATPSVIQRNFKELFGYAHSHDVLSAAPDDSDGDIGDIKLAVISGSFYLYAKFSAGWKRVALS